MLALACLFIATVYGHHGEMVNNYLNLSPGNKTGVQYKALRVIIAKKT